MERIDRDRYRLSSGRVIHANHGLIGIAQDDSSAEDSAHGFEISEGYDGHLEITGTLDYTTDQRRDGWTPEEQIELAEFMIAQWQAFTMATKQATCQAVGHDWGDWWAFSKGLSPTQAVWLRRCARCQIEERRAARRI